MARSQRNLNHLYVVHTASFFMEVYQTALAAKAAGHSIFFVFAYEHWTTEKYSALCHQAGFKVVSRLKPGVMTSFVGLSEKFLAKAMGLRSYTLFGFVVQFSAEMIGLLLSRKNISRILNETRADLVVQTIDVPGYDTGLFIRLAKKRGAGTAIISSSMSNGMEQAEVYFYDENHHLRGPVACLLNWLFPKWKRVHKGRALLRVSPARILALELLGISPPLPWVVNSGLADAILVESQAMFDYFGRAGLPLSQMRVTGTTTDDVMSKLISNVGARLQLCQRYGLDREKPIVLVAVPPNSFIFKGGRPECDFKSYEEMIQFFVGSVAHHTAVNVVLALHPSVPRVDGLHFEKDHVKVAYEKTSELVPLCDFYVASISSTIRWAIACGKPVINYDVYRYRYDDFVHEPAVLTTEEKDTYREYLRRMITDPLFFKEMKAAQDTRASLWGRLDGESGVRILKALDQVVGRFR